MQKKTTENFSFCLSCTDLVKKAGGFSWIGLSFTASLDNWNWSDGTPFSYSNWVNGYPSVNTNHCVEVSNRSNDLSFYLKCFMQIFFT